MELKEVFTNRRTIRKYSNKKVPYETVYEILEQANLAPSSGNLQNWFFIIITNKDLKEKLAKACLEQNWMLQAPVWIAICNDKDHIKLHYPKREKYYSRQNCAFAASHILLSATDKGLGTAVVGAFDEHAVRRLLKLPSNMIPEMIITLGHPAETFTGPHKREPLHIKLRFDSWENKKRDTSTWPLHKHIVRTKEKVKETKEKTKSGFQKFLEKFKK